jgi:flagellar hook-basal body complex protein FliE
MPSPIQAIGNIRPPEPAPVPETAGRPGEFRAALEGAIRRVDGYRSEAGAAVERFLSGEAEELHTVALATQRAELAFEMFLQVRNKVVQAYQEIMRMQM